LDSCLAAIIALLLFFVLSLSMIFICLPYNSFIRNVGPNVCSLLKSSDRSVMSWPFLFLFHKICVTFIATYGSKTQEIYMMHNNGIATLCLFVRNFPLLTFFKMIATTCYIYPFHNVAQLWLVLLYEFGIYASFLAMSTFYSFDDKFYFRFKDQLLIATIISFVFWVF